MLVLYQCHLITMILIINFLHIDGNEYEQYEKTIDHKKLNITNEQLASNVKIKLYTSKIKLLTGTIKKQLNVSLQNYSTYKTFADNNFCVYTSHITIASIMCDFHQCQLYQLFLSRFDCSMFIFFLNWEKTCTAQDSYHIM